MSENGGVTAHEFDGPLGEDWKVFAADDPDFNLRIVATEFRDTWTVGTGLFDGAVRVMAVFYDSDGSATTLKTFDTLDAAEAFIASQTRRDSRRQRITGGWSGSFTFTGGDVAPYVVEED